MRRNSEIYSFSFSISIDASGSKTLSGGMLYDSGLLKLKINQLSIDIE